MKSCEDVLDLLPDHVPRLTGDALEVHEHLRGCHECADAADELAHTLDLLRGQSDAAPALADDFADQVLAALPAAGAPAGQVISPSWIPLATRAAAAITLFVLGLGSARLLDRAPTNVAHTTPPSHGAPGPAVAGGHDDATPFDAGAADGGVDRQAFGYGDPAQLARVPQAQTDPRLRYASYGGGLERYVQEAGIVLRAVDALEQPDPRWLDAVALHIHDEALLEQGEQLLLRLEAEPGEPQLRRLISGTQMLLLKLRNAGAAPTSMRAVRVELRTTGLLEAYDALLAVDEAGQPVDEPPPGAAPNQTTDPL